MLYSAIWYYTQPPAYIHMLASEIIENVMKAQQVNGVFNFMCLNYHKHTGLYCNCYSVIIEYGAQVSFLNQPFPHLSFTILIVMRRGIGLFKDTIQQDRSLVFSTLLRECCSFSNTTLGPQSTSVVESRQAGLIMRKM